MEPKVNESRSDKVMEAAVNDLLGSAEPAPIEPAPIVLPVVPPVEPVPPIVEPAPVVPPVVPPVIPPEVSPVEPVVVPPVVEPPPIVKPGDITVPPPVVEPPPVVPAADPRDVEITALRGTVDELRRMIETVASQATAPRPAAEPLVPDPNAEPVVIKFVEKEEDLDKILNNIDNFNAFLTKAFTDNSRTILEAMPHLVTKATDTVVTQKMAVNEFYAHNQDLAGNKAYVGMVANDLAAKNPTWNLENVIKNLGAEVRARLKMLPAGTPPVVAPPGTPSVAPVEEPPAFVPGSPSRPGGGGPNMTRMEADVADLISGM